MRLITQGINQNLLKYTMALSALMHLTGFYFFASLRFDTDTLQTPPVIRIKQILAETADMQRSSMSPYPETLKRDKPDSVRKPQPAPVQTQLASLPKPMAASQAIPDRLSLSHETLKAIEFASLTNTTSPILTASANTASFPGSHPSSTQALPQPSAIMTASIVTPSPSVGEFRASITSRQSPQRLANPVTTPGSPFSGGAVPVSAHAKMDQRIPSNSSAPLMLASLPADFSLWQEDSRQESNSPQGIPAEDIGLLRSGFSKEIWTRIASAKRYPKIARNRGYEGSPVVGFILGNDGRLQDIHIIEPSRHAILDREAMEAVRRAAPYPPIPSELKMDSISFRLPVSFILEEP